MLRRKQLHYLSDSTVPCSERNIIQLNVHVILSLTDEHERGTLDLGQLSAINFSGLQLDSHNVALSLVYKFARNTDASHFESHLLKND
jgi:hypothetical protein